MQNEAKSNVYLNQLKEHDNYETIKDTLNPQNYNMIVTPKEIDDLIENMKDVVARGINKSLWNFDLIEIVVSNFLLYIIAKKIYKWYNFKQEKHKKGRIIWEKLYY